MKKTSVATSSYKPDKSIFKRWVANTLVAAVVVLVVFGVAFAFFLKSYHYDSANQLMLSRADYVLKTIETNEKEHIIDIDELIITAIAEFEYKEQMEIQAIDHEGLIEFSSTGFSYSDEAVLTDYTIALSSPEGVGTVNGESEYSENIMAVSFILPYINSNYSALRFVVSLESVDVLIFWSVFAYGCVSVIIVMIMLVTGIYFVKSIVSPIKQIGAMAEQIAQGDLEARLTPHHKDEIGQLCMTVNDMAERISSTNKMKSEFISSLSHELRTPLTAIKGWAETVDSCTDTEDPIFTKGMDVIKGETDRLSMMVEELLDFSRMQTTGFTLFYEKLDVQKEIEGAISIYESKIINEEKILVYKTANKIEDMYADKNRLRQIFINLIDNAVKYTEKGDYIYITVESDEKEVIVEIRDTGCGILPKDVPNVKEKFYKANNTKKGSGIGLSMVDEIVKMHEGSFEISSRYKIGTTVTVKIPYKKTKFNKKDGNKN